MPVSTVAKYTNDPKFILLFIIRTLGMQQYYNISIYCNIYYSNTIQYNLMDIAQCNILWYITIYCNVCCLNVINVQSVHHKNDRISSNLDYTLEFFTLLYSYSYTGCIFFSLLPKLIFPYEMSFTKIQSNVAIWQYNYCNTLKHNTQYGIDPYYFTPNVHTYV